MSQSIAIRAVSVADPNEVHEFPSLMTAKRALQEWQGKNVCHSQIKKYAQKGETKHGFRWELVPVEGAGNAAGAAVPEHFTFRDCVEGIFNGGRLRVTSETPKRVSVFDLIELVIESKNPRSVYERMCADNAEVVPHFDNLQFPGAGQRATPVTDARGALMIVNLLPGNRARMFRVSAMETLTRFLAGDATLHDEIDANAEAQAALPAEHPMQAISEYVQNKVKKHELHSPRMKGKTINMFNNRPVVYILVWVHNGQQYIKVGYSTNFKLRWYDLQAEYPGCILYTVIETNRATYVEAEWKSTMKDYNKTVIINDKPKTELFINVTPEYAEQFLMDIANTEDMQDASKRDIAALRIKTDEEIRMLQEAQRMRIEEDDRKHQREMELIEKKMAHELEMKRLELQILQLKHGVGA